MSARAAIFKGILVIAVLAAHCFFPTAVATTVTPQPTLKGLAGVWLGGTEANAEYLRIELDEHGKGILTVQYVPKGEAEAYLIMSVSLNGTAIRFELRPTNGAEVINLHGYANEREMSLSVEGADHKWKRNALIEREEAVLDRIRSVTDRAREIKRQEK